MLEQTGDKTLLTDCQACNPVMRGSGQTSRAVPEATPPANQVWRSCYHADGSRIATRIKKGATGADHVHCPFADHLGSSNFSDRSDVQVGWLLLCEASRRARPWDESAAATARR